ncbi:MAG: hypothetical protein ACLU8S_14160 [Coprococcus phoceensis]
MGIGNIKVVFQSGFSIVFTVKNGNAVCAPVYPAPKLPVPSLDLQDGGGVWALGVDKQLFIERKPVVAAGRSQKRPPLVRSCHAACVSWYSSVKALYRIAIGCPSFSYSFFAAFSSAL